MRVNIFEGFRRLTWLAIALWLLGMAAAVIFYDPPVEMTYVVSAPGQPPMLRPDPSSCGPFDASKIVWATSERGRSVRLKFCFEAHKSDAGELLIPFKTQGDKWIMNTAYSDDVNAYTDSVMADFVKSFRDAALADEKSEIYRRWEIIKGVVSGIGGALAIWIVSRVLGWIIRGFLSIPRGQDYRPG